MASKEINILIKAKNLASGAIKSVNRELGTIGKHAQRGLGNAARNIERGVMMAGAAAAGGLAYAVKTAIDFEAAFAGVKKTVDETANFSYPKLRAELEKISRIKPQSFEELAQIGEFGGQLGVKADNLTDFVDTVSDFLVAVPQMDLEAAAFGLQRMSVLTKTADEDFDRIASTVVELGNNFATTEDAILDAGNRFASVAHMAGMSQSSILALSTAATALGSEPQAAGTALQRLFQRIQLAIADGGKKAELFADISGRSVKQFRTDWERDAEGTLLDFLKSLGEVESAVEQTAILKDLGLSDARLGRVVMGLANNFNVTEDAMTSANSEWKANSALTEEAAKRYETAAAQLAILKNNLRLAAATIGNEVLPVVVEMAKEFTDWLQLDSTQTGIREFAKDVAREIRGMVEWGKGLNWEAIGSAMQTAAAAGKVLLEAFLSMPGWLQGAIATGWGLNKLTGGAFGAIIGELGKGLIKGILGINAGVVNINAATVNGVPGGGVAGGGGRGLLGTAAKFVLGPLAAVAIGKEIAQPIIGRLIGPAKQAQGAAIQAVLDSGDSQRIVGAISAIDDQLNSSDIGTQIALIGSRIPYIGDALGQVAPTLERQRADLKAELSRIWETTERGAAAARDAIPWHQRNLAEIHNLNMSEAQRGAAKEANDAARASAHRAMQADATAAVRATHGPLHTIANKNFSPLIQVSTHVNSFVSINEWQRVARSAQTSYSTNTGGI